METTIRDMEVHIATQKNEIETLKNRNGFPQIYLKIIFFVVIQI